MSSSRVARLVAIRLVVAGFLAAGWVSSHAAAAPPKLRSFSGFAAYYAQGAKLASGERFDPAKLTAAHRSLPFGTRVRVTDPRTGRSVIVTINDRGPFNRGRVIDLSLAAARALGMISRGTIYVHADVCESASCAVLATP